MTAQTKQELNSLTAHELHKIACAILGVDDEDHEFDEVSERVEEILVNMINGEVLSVLEQLQASMIVQSASSNPMDYVSFHSKNIDDIESIKNRCKL